MTAEKSCGDYELSRREQEDLLFLNEKKIPVVLLLNTGGPVELTDILEQAKNIRAVLNISQPGQAGGYAVADILFGKAVPSGKLTATWARHYGGVSVSGYLWIQERRSGKGRIPGGNFRWIPSF